MGRLGGVSGLGENNPPLVADEERNAKIVFKLSDLTAQRRLGDVQFLRGLAEIQSLDRAAMNDRSLDNSIDADDGDFRRIDDGRRDDAAEAA